MFMWFLGPPILCRGLAASAQERVGVHDLRGVGLGVYRLGCSPL